MLKRLIWWIRAYFLRGCGWLTHHSLALTIGVLLVAFLVVFLFDRIFVSVYPGQAGVLWSRFQGTLTEPGDIYPEGLHIIFPLHIMYRYDLRYQILRRQVTALTRDGLEISADLGLLYRVKKELVGHLHQDVGENYVEALIIPTLDATARHILGTIEPEKVYVDRSSDIFGKTGIVESNLLEQAKENVGERYVEVRDLSILRIVLPDRVQMAIQQKREEQQRALLYYFRLDRERREAQRKQIEAEGIRDFQDTISGGLTDKYLKFKGIEATLELARSPNTKVVVVGDTDGLPLILGTLPQPIEHNDGNQQPEKQAELKSGMEEQQSEESDP